MNEDSIWWFVLGAWVPIPFFLAAGIVPWGGLVWTVPITAYALLLQARK
jgi:hypothetical protein